MTSPRRTAAALAFDLLTLAGLILLGRRMRAGPEGRTLGYALGFAWAAYPYALFSLQTNSNDTLVALLTVAAMLGLTVGRPRASAMAQGAAVALAAAAKFAPLALAPLFATARGVRQRRLVRRSRSPSLLVAVFAPFVPDGGLREIYDRSVGYQASRPSPFSVWGQHESLDWLQTAVQAGNRPARARRRARAAAQDARCRWRPSRVPC